MIKVVDNFVDEFDGFRDYCDFLDYSGVINPLDGVMYPGISDKVPRGVIERIRQRAADVIDEPVIDTMTFLRLTVEGESVPHQAHNDRVMGDYGLIIYLNREDDCQGGTSFVEHKVTGMRDNPANDAEDKAWRDDHNDYDAWNVYKMIEMVPNRGFFFKSSLMHRAELPNNFGKAANDGRLALITFFKVA